jgi:nudix-type nucleoside diphosphatase (YffH/AdpP family)
MSENNRLRNLESQTLIKNWGALKKVTFEYLRSDGSWQKQQREVYDRGDGVAVLPFDPKRKTVLLTRQFRIPTYLNGNNDGHLIEVPAGKLDKENPDEQIRAEIREETGYEVSALTKRMTLFMSPGSVTEKLYLYTAEYWAGSKRADGGGLRDEGEDIEVLEVPLSEAVSRIGRDVLDAKTVILLQWAAANLT